MMNHSPKKKPNSEYSPGDVKEDSESESLRNGDDDQFHDETNNTDDVDEHAAIPKKKPSTDLKPSSIKKKKRKKKSASSSKKDDNQRSSSRPNGTRKGGSGEQQQGTDDVDEDGYRRHKYSTADQPVSRNARCKKYCWLFLMFVIMMIIMFALSKLMEYFFFNKKSDNTDMSEYVRDMNATFPKDKFSIDSACSRGQLDADEGIMCNNLCQPVYYECCDPFNEFDLYKSYTTIPPTYVNTSDDDQFINGMTADDYNRTDSTNSTNSTNSTYAASAGTTNNTSTRYVRKYQVRRRYMLEDDNEEELVYMSPDEIALRVLQGNTTGATNGEYNVPITVAPVYWNDEKQNLDEAIAAKANDTCTISRELDGCVRYAKCQASLMKVPPAPATLPVMCNTTSLTTDPGKCQEICTNTHEDISCCIANDSTNCIAKNFDICLDYSPCQNLKRLSDKTVDPNSIIPSASQVLDQQCFYKQELCLEECAIAESCSNRNSLSYQINFLQCLTYVPCNNITSTHIYVPKQFTYLDRPPEDLITSCKRPSTNTTSTVFVLQDPNAKSCKELCEPAKCCWASSPADSCFMDDPLACLAWEQQCQILLDYPNL